MSDLYRPKGLSSAVCYLDPKAAFRWLEEAFGFEPLMVILDENENIAHSEMKYGDSVVMIGNEWSADHRIPKPCTSNSRGARTSTPTVNVRAKRAPKSCRSHQHNSMATGRIVRVTLKGTSGRLA
jgi:uncharacterized glyoxalase superfamily protein PhnB